MPGARQPDRRANDAKPHGWRRHDSVIVEIGGHVVRRPEQERRRGDLAALAAHERMEPRISLGDRVEREARGRDLHEAASRTRPQPGARRGRSAGPGCNFVASACMGRRLRAGVTSSPQRPRRGIGRGRTNEARRGRRSSPWRLHAGGRSGADTLALGERSPVARLPWLPPRGAAV
jgi:hypothetical protein